MDIRLQNHKCLCRITLDGNRSKDLYSYNLVNSGANNGQYPHFKTVYNTQMIPGDGFKVVRVMKEAG